MSRLARYVLCTGGAAWIVNAVIRWVASPPLGHDEARYALDARDMLEGVSTRFIYSAGGMRLVALPGLLAGGSERALRVLPVLLGLVFLVVAWKLARRFFGDTTAAFTVAILATSPQLAVHSSELLSDIPSTTCVLLAIMLLDAQLRTAERPTWRMLGVALLFAAAFYLRYGSVAAIAVVSAVYAVIGWRAVRARPLVVIAAAGLFAALVAPHFIQAQLQTGHPLGILRISAEIPGPGEGILSYVSAPLTKYGVVVAATMVIGIVGIRRDRVAIALLVIASAHVLLLSVTTQSQARFIYMPTVILVALGVEFVRLHIEKLGRVPRMTVVGVMCAAIAAGAGNEIINGTTQRDRRLEREGPMITAAELVRRDRGTIGCEVLAETDLTRLEWYSGCRAEFRHTAAAERVYQIQKEGSLEDGFTARIVGRVPGFFVVRLLDATKL